MVFDRYNLDPSETFMPNLIHHVYSSALVDLSSRRLALLYIIMAIGLQVDASQQVDTPRAEVYHILARAAICGTPVMEHPDLDLMHTLVRLTISDCCSHCSHDCPVLYDVVLTSLVR